MPTFDDVSGLSDNDLDKELFFAEQSVEVGDDLTEGWLDHLRAEKARRS